MAVYEIKVMMIELLTHFEMKFPKGQQRQPEPSYDGMGVIPNEKVEVLFKGKGGAEECNWPAGKKANHLGCVCVFVCWGIRLAVLSLWDFNKE